MKRPAGAKKLVVLDLNVISEAQVRTELLPAAKRQATAFLFPQFEIEELLGDDEDWPKTIHIHAQILLPLLSHVHWARSVTDLENEECITASPSSRIVDEAATKVARLLLRAAAASVESAEREFRELADLREPSNIRRNLEAARNALHISEQDYADIDPQKYRRLAGGDTFELAGACALVGVIEALKRIPGFRHLKPVQQQRIVSNSTLSRFAMARFALPQFYAASQRDSASKGGKRARNDIYDMCYAVFGSLTDGLRSNDMKGPQQGLYAAINEGAQLLQDIPDADWPECMRRAEDELSKLK